MSYRLDRETDPKSTLHVLVGMLPSDEYVMVVYSFVVSFVMG